MIKKLAISTFAMVIFAACGVTSGPGNKEDVNNKIEQQHYRNDQMNDQQWDNNQNRNNLNRKQLRDDMNPNSGNTNNLGPDNENIKNRNLVR